MAQAIGHAAIVQGYRVVHREAHTLLEELAESTLAGTRKDLLALWRNTRHNIFWLSDGMLPQSKSRGIHQADQDAANERSK